MPKSLENILLFIIAAMVQLFMLNYLDLSIYLRPMIYVAFVLLLPTETLPVWVLLSAFAMGALMDLGTGMAGLNTAATLPVAFARPLLLRIATDKDGIREGGMPTSGRLGTGPFLRYCFAGVMMHSFLFFSLEAATLSYYYLTLIRIVLSGAVSVGMVFLMQLFFVRR